MNLNNYLINEENECLVDNGTMHIILKNEKYFLNLILDKAYINTIYGC